MSSPKSLETGLVSIARRILQKCPQIVSGNRGENLIYFYLIAHFDHRVHRKQPWFLQWKLVSREAALACICHYPTQPIFITFPTMKAPWILLCSHIWDYITKKIQKCCAFFISQSSEGPDVYLNIAQAAIMTQIPIQEASPEPKYFTGEATKVKSRNILAHLFRHKCQGRPCCCLICSSHVFSTLLLCQMSHCHISKLLTKSSVWHPREMLSSGLLFEEKNTAPQCMYRIIEF